MSSACSRGDTFGGARRALRVTGHAFPWHHDAFGSGLDAEQAGWTLLDRASSARFALIALGFGIDTARYGHRVSFHRPDRQPAAKPLTVLENRNGYEALQERLQQLHRRHPLAHFHVRIDAAGQYAANLEYFLRGLDLPMTLSIGEPKRNKDYQKAHYPQPPPTIPKAKPWRGR